MTKITMETCYGVVTVEVPEDNLNISQVRDDLLKPLLLATGYHPDNVDELFRE
jgi:hypothetical protein